MRLTANLTWLMAIVSGGLHCGIIYWGSYNQKTTATSFDHKSDICYITIMPDYIDATHNTHGTKLAQNSVHHFNHAKAAIQPRNPPLSRAKLTTNHDKPTGDFSDKVPSTDSLTVVADTHTTRQHDLTEPTSQTLNQHAICVYKFEPVYPLIARELHYEGTVIIRLKIMVDGRIDRHEILESSGYDCLDQCACTAVSQWTFSPAYSCGLPIASQIDIPIEFMLAPS